MRRSGFTLVEISIVLIIIGLIIGGVMVGRDLIGAAVVRGDIALVEKYSAAVQTFKLKYSCIPGDCANARQFGLSPSGTGYDNGNGDGKIGRYVGNTSQNECLNFWYHMGKSGVIEDSYRGYYSTGSRFALHRQRVGPNNKGNRRLDYNYW